MRIKQGRFLYYCFSYPNTPLQIEGVYLKKAIVKILLKPIKETKKVLFLIINNKKSDIMTRFTDVINLIERSYKLQIRLQDTQNKIKVYERTIDLYNNFSQEFYNWGDINVFKELSSKAEGLSKQVEVLTKLRTELDREVKGVQVNLMTLSKLKEQELNRNINLN